MSRLRAFEKSERGGPPGGLARLAGWLVFGATLLETGGCAILTVGGQEPRTTYYPGVLRISLVADRNAPLYGSLRGVGLMTTPTGTTIGWMRERLAVVPDAKECRAVVFVDSDEDARAILQSGLFQVPSQSP